MSIDKPEEKTPQEWAEEAVNRVDPVDEEASSIEKAVTAVVVEAVAYERQQCAKIAEEYADWRRKHSDPSWAACYGIQMRIESRGEVSEEINGKK